MMNRMLPLNCLKNQDSFIFIEFLKSPTNSLNDKVKTQCFNKCMYYVLFFKFITCTVLCDTTIFFFAPACEFSAGAQIVRKILWSWNTASWWLLCWNSFICRYLISMYYFIIVISLNVVKKGPWSNDFISNKNLTKFNAF